MCCYARGCRCEKCKQYNADKNARYVAGRKVREPRWKGAGPRNVVLPHNSDLRNALAACDMGTVRRLLREMATVTTESDCWIWPMVNDSGYPTIRKGLLHRQVLEVKCGAPLGVQQAHHTCGMRKCVNPDHLQPVTHQQNIAEMMQRTTYLARIRELEQALASAAPDHPALNTVPVL